MNEPRWKKEVRGLVFILVILSGIAGLVSAYFDIEYHKAGADKPTAEKNVANTQHAKTKYISIAEAERIRLFWTIFLIAFPSSILLGVVMRFVFKVDILKEEPMPAWVENLKDNMQEKHL